MSREGRHRQGPVRPRNSSRSAGTEPTSSAVRAAIWCSTQPVAQLRRRPSDLRRPCVMPLPPDALCRGAENGDMNGVLVFDGRCGMCTRVCNRLARLDRTGRVRIEPFQTPGTADRLGVSADRLPEAACWLNSSGAVFAGALQNSIYRWLAAHRHRFRGVTPPCKAEPARCA
jgi:predicted DCC family thiol-disulfide oxidoreductase YuxK